MKNKLLALLAAFGLVATVHAVEINENISINGFIDGAWTNTDDNGANNDDNDLDIDEVELNFIVNAGSVSGEIHIDDDDDGGNLGNIEQAHFSYSLENGLSITVGRFGSALGFEGQDPAGLYTYSRAYDDGTSIYNIGNIDGGNGQQVEGLSLGYSADAFSIAVSAVNGVGTEEEGTVGGVGFEDDLNVEIALTYTGIENLVLGGGMHSTSGRTGVAPLTNDVDITNIHAAYTMDKLMLGGEYINVDEDTAADDLSAYLILADYDINDKMGIAVRYSEWETGANAESDRITVAPNYAITESLGAILEYSSAEDNAGNEEDTLALELTFTF
ncbi:MAG: outer membrane beta-barrel protein [Opitutales bacterium]